MKLSGVSIIWEYAKKDLKLNLVIVVVLALESKGGPIVCSRIYSPLLNLKRKGN